MPIAVVAAFALAANLSGHSATAATWPASVTLKVCNRTGNTALVASSYIPAGASQWRNQGWTRVGAGTCQDMFSTINRLFYARAEVVGHPDIHWGSDIARCVRYPGPYDFVTAGDATACPDGKLAGYETFHSDGHPVYVWNLDP